MLTFSQVNSTSHTINNTISLIKDFSRNNNIISIISFNNLIGIIITQMQLTGEGIMDTTDIMDITDIAEIGEIGHIAGTIIMDPMKMSSKNSRIIKFKILPS